MYTENDLVPNSIWKHVKTGNLYRVLQIGILANNGPMNGQLGVVYTRHDVPSDWYFRDMREFLDGRFVKEQQQNESSI